MMFLHWLPVKQRMLYKLSSDALRLCWSSTRIPDKLCFYGVCDLGHLMQLTMNSLEHAVLMQLFFLW